jgi:hypothetical protein
VDAVTGDAPGPRDGGCDDAVLARRARFARAASVGQRAGYGAFGVAVVAFAAGALWEFTTAVVAVVTAALVVGSLLLAPAIILGYAVRAAERDDREHGR